MKYLYNNKHQAPERVLLLERPAENGASFISDEDRKHAVITKVIGDYEYTIINKGFNNYIFVERTKIL